MNQKNDSKILFLIDVFTKPDSSFRLIKTEEDIEKWHPATEEERLAYESLIANENRELLKEWYAKRLWVAGPADLFRRLLEHGIGEKIPQRSG